MSYFKFKIQGRMQGLNDYVKDNRGAKGKFYGNKMKQAQTDDVVEQLLKLDELPETFTRPVTVEFHWIETNARRDPDNFIFAKKFVLDGMVKAGLLPNDGMKNIAGFVDSWEVLPDTNGGVIVTVREVV